MYTYMQIKFQLKSVNEARQGPKVYLGDELRMY